MAVELRRRPLGWPPIRDWFDEFPLAPHTEIEAQKIRVEEYEENGAYLVRAELPGVDPDNDIDVVVEEGVLTVRAERREEKDKDYSEFRYGSFLRSVQLPPGADADDVEVSYDRGVLTVTALMGGPEKTGEKIEITRR